MYTGSKVDLARKRPARITEISQPYGQQRVRYQRICVDKQNKSTREELTNYMKSQYLAEKLDRMDRSEPNDLSTPFKLVLESNRARCGATDLNLATAAIPLEGLFSHLPSDPRQREKEEDGKADTDSAQKPKKKRTAD